ASLAMPTWRSTGLPGDRANCLLGLVDDRDEPTLATCPEDDAPVALGEDRVVAAEARAWARAEARPALADDARPRGHALAVEHLDAEHLGRRVAPVPR